MFTLDAQQNRHYADYADERVQSFARAHPGRLYIVGDEPDQYCTAPSDYAIWYHEFVEGVRAADPTARFSPAGFAEPNWHCCPLPDDVPAPCWTEKHSISYAEQFYNAHVNRYGVPPRVDEWRFHDFAINLPVGDVRTWWARVQREVDWSVAHGAPMVLGTWGFSGWNESLPAFQEHIKQAIGLILSDSRIKGAVYWSREPWVHSPHYLMYPDGSLTAEGQTFVNPLTDVPTGLKLVGSTNGDAKLRWANTTSAWSSEVEFWVQAPGSNAFVYRTTARTDLAAAQSGFVEFKGGERVKARVRYYNVYGQAEWSPFSNSVLIIAPEDQAPAFGKRPIYCFLGLC